MAFSININSIIAYLPVLFIFHYIKCANVCDKHFCSTDSITQGCMKTIPSLVVSDLQFNVTVNLCGDNSYCQSPSRSQWSTTQTQTYSCATTAKVPLVDGEVCTTGTDCVSGVCDGKIRKACKGLDLSASCTNTNQCVAKSYCDPNTKTCQTLKPVGSKCNSDEECVNLAGCLNNMCVLYYSLPPKTPIDATLGELYCNTSYVYKGVCTTLRNVYPNPYECNSTQTCRYQIMENNDIVDIPELCVCGYNSLGKSYCQHGADSVTYQMYVEARKRALKRDCHVSKKDSCNNEVGVLEIINQKNLYMSWKGYYQLSDTCLSDFYSSENYFKVYNVLLLIFIIILI
jgi:hypothetical protein